VDGHGKPISILLTPGACYESQMAQPLVKQGAVKSSGGRPRNQLERFFNRLKQNRPIATRHEKRVINYFAMITIAAILMWL
jgi:transposase